MQPASKARAVLQWSTESPLEQLQKVARVHGVPPDSAILKLLFTGLRLAKEDRWSELEALQQADAGYWYLRGMHFDMEFEHCEGQAVVPMHSQDTFSFAQLVRMRADLQVSVLYCALVDADGDVVLYDFKQPPFASHVADRQLWEPAPHLQENLEAALAASGPGNADGEPILDKGGKKRKRQ